MFYIMIIEASHQYRRFRMPSGVQSDREMDISDSHKSINHITATALPIAMLHTGWIVNT